MLAPIIVAIPKFTKGKLALVPKNKDGKPLTSRVEALDAQTRLNAGVAYDTSFYKNQS